MLSQSAYPEGAWFLPRIDKKGQFFLNGKMVYIYPCHNDRIHSSPTFGYLNISILQRLAPGPTGWVRLNKTLREPELRCGKAAGVHDGWFV